MATNAMAEQPEMENTGVAQLPVPEREYAGGGIIAFSRGSLVDLDDDELDPYEDYSKATAAIQRANAMPVARPSIFPKSYEAALAEKGQTPASIRQMMINAPKKGDYVMPPLDVPKRGGHKYEDMVIKEAQRIGLDPSIAVHALYKETGNLKNPESAKSSAGAIGVMQLMPKTAKELGVDPLVPEDNIRGGVMYLKKMYDKYQDPTLALAAYNAGPGRIDKILQKAKETGQHWKDLLPAETQNYIKKFTSNTKTPRTKL
jgi:soluble lytic murein transglycosylase-like protein